MKKFLSHFVVTSKENLAKKKTTKFRSLTSFSVQSWSNARGRCITFHCKERVRKKLSWIFFLRLKVIIVCVCAWKLFVSGRFNIRRGDKKSFSSKKCGNIFVWMVNSTNKTFCCPLHQRWHRRRDKTTRRISFSYHSKTKRLIREWIQNQGLKLLKNLHQNHRNFDIRRRGDLGR